MSIARAVVVTVVWIGRCLLAPGGCLLLGDRPPIESANSSCLADDLGSAFGTDLASESFESSFDFDCQNGSDPVVFAWKAPFAGDFRFLVEGEGLELLVEITEPKCEGVSECSHDFVLNRVERIYSADTSAETIYIRVQAGAFTSGDFTLSIAPVVDDNEPDDTGENQACPYEGDGECDEPEGTGLCVDGSDSADC